MKKKVLIRELLGWLVANLILPLIAPFVIVFICAFFAGIVGQISAELWNFHKLFDILLNNGVYAFLSITMLLSLLQDYKIAVSVITGWLALAYILFLLGLGFLFLRSLHLITGDTAYSVEEAKNMFIYLSLSSVLFATILKRLIIKCKIKESYKL
ncbi:hypothetical protein AGMMS49982_02680 [Bacteroidia bacterium]|nr:hypothetical protein AGMMS49982_02680 [Bacteroidia bacterium]